MRRIDSFAYGNRIRRIDPAFKAGFSLLMILTCLIADRLPVSVGVLLLVLSCSVFLAGLPLRPTLKILAGESAFLFFSVLSIAVSISRSPANEFRLILTRDSALAALNLLTRTIGCMSAMNFLSMTTPMTDLIDLMRRLRFPEIIIDLMTLIYRSVFTLLDCLERMIAAKEARLGFRSFRTSFRSVGEIAANLFLETYRKSRKMQLSLESRCWDGPFRVIPQTYEPICLLWKKDAS